MKAFALLLAAILAGCATPYGSFGLRGGYFESPVNEHLMKVNFSGNGNISAGKVQTFALYRCAEVSRDFKKPYFVIYDSLVAAALNTPSSRPAVGTLAGKPMAFAFVSMEDAYRSGAHDTNSTLNELAPEVGRATSAGK
jgi:hypothetical protein